MSTEIEAKLKVESLEAVAERLGRLGAEFLQEHLQNDCYFDNAEKALTGGDKCLRLRQEGVGGRSKFVLTYKGPREKGRFKKREETEIKIKDAASIRKLLCAIGYEQVLVFEKKRRLWRFGMCLVALDELPLLGKFVEIEGPSESEIADVQAKLGLADLPHIPQSYASLLAAKVSE